MNYKQSIPDYLTNRKNTIIQTVFTAIFAYVFINIYQPFGAENWYKINELQFRVFSLLVVVTGMMVIILTRTLLLLLKRSHEITLALFIWLITAEVVLMAGFYTSFEIFLLDDNRKAHLLFINAMQNVVLILLIPYLLSSLFFAWTDIKTKLEQVIQQFRDPKEVFIHFKDEKDKVRISLKLADVLYFESTDNYVKIIYRDNDKVKHTLIRITLKALVENLSNYPIYRCHRKYAVNVSNVKLLKKGKKNYFIVLNDSSETEISVSKTYEEIILKNISLKS